MKKLSLLLMAIGLVITGFVLFGSQSLKNDVIGLFRKNDIGYQCFNLYRFAKPEWTDSLYHDSSQKNSNAITIFFKKLEDGTREINGIGDCQLSNGKIDEPATLANIKKIAEQEHADFLNQHIAEMALSPYTRKGYPKTVEAFGKRLKEVEILRKQAAEMVLDDKRCRYVDESQLSTSKSHIEMLYFRLDCDNYTIRINTDEQEIRNYRF